MQHIPKSEDLLIPHVYDYYGHTGGLCWANQSLPSEKIQKINKWIQQIERIQSR